MLLTNCRKTRVEFTTSSEQVLSDPGTNLVKDEDIPSRVHGVADESVLNFITLNVSFKTQYPESVQRLAPSSLS